MRIATTIQGFILGAVLGLAAGAIALAASPVTLSAAAIIGFAIGGVSFVSYNLGGFSTETASVHVKEESKARSDENTKKDELEIDNNMTRQAKKKSEDLNSEMIKTELCTLRKELTDLKTEMQKNLDLIDVDIHELKDRHTPTPIFRRDPRSKSDPESNPHELPIQQMETSSQNTPAELITTLGVFSSSNQSNSRQPIDPYTAANEEHSSTRTRGTRATRIN